MSTAPIAQGPVDVNVRPQLDNGATCCMCGGITSNQDGTPDGGCLKCVKREYWLQSDAQRKGWGPFKVEDDAWRYLFGRDSTEQERQQYREADWYVGYINKWPNNRI